MDLPRALLRLLVPVVLFCGAPLLAGDLAEDVRAIVTSKAAAKGQIGVQIVRLGASPSDSPVVAAHNAATPLVPASNLKLLTTSAALQVLGGDFRYSTQLLMDGDALIVLGDGDPTLGDAELLKKHGWTTTTLFENWAELLKSHGHFRVGEVIVDDSIFDEEFFHPSWPADQAHRRYAAQVAGLNLNGNCLDFFLMPGRRGEVVSYRTDPPTAYAKVNNTCVFGPRNAVWLSRELGTNHVILKGETNAANEEPISVSLHDPSLYFGTVLIETLRKNGIEVAGQVRRERRGLNGWSHATLLARHETPIEVVIRRANKDSVNLYAEALMKRLALGPRARPEGGGSWALGRSALSAYLSALGVKAAERVIEDGSGLSRANRLSANAITRLLVADFFGPNRQMFLDSLAVGGVDGTLDNRFRDDLKGRVFAKTGYVANARCLSGFVRTKSDDWYAFAILINGPVGAEGRRIHEQIVAAIDRNGGQ